ncbi:hypothetical protein [Novosphingobium sp. B 225]|uniref:hypothetical protein n=1 Tax=Novosphingobium sp. B 225 TaxID=1961849 RepID=UPI000B4BF477|nr:hypothetical protein [Novosphingobium sp. B 225]
MGNTGTLRAVALLLVAVAVASAQPAEAKKRRFSITHRHHVTQYHSATAQPSMAPQPSNRHVNPWAKNDASQRSWFNKEKFWLLGGLLLILAGGFLGHRGLLAWLQASPDDLPQQ